jgi:hypothetical protein
LQLNQVKLVTKHVKKFAVYACARDTPASFDLLFEVDVPASERNQIHAANENVSSVKSRFLKVIVLEGYAPFSAVYSIVTQGSGPMIGN